MLLNIVILSCTAYTVYTELSNFSGSACCQLNSCMPSAQLLDKSKAFVRQHDASTLKILLYHRQFSMTTHHGKSTACSMALTASAGLLYICKKFDTTFKAGQETEHSGVPPLNRSNAALNSDQCSKLNPSQS